MPPLELMITEVHKDMHAIRAGSAYCAPLPFAATLCQPLMVQCALRPPPLPMPPLELMITEVHNDMYAIRAGSAYCVPTALRSNSVSTLNGAVRAAPATISTDTLPQAPRESSPPVQCALRQSRPLTTTSDLPRIQHPSRTTVASCRHPDVQCALRTSPPPATTD